MYLLHFKAKSDYCKEKKLEIMQMTAALWFSPPPSLLCKSPKHCLITHE